MKDAKKKIGSIVLASTMILSSNIILSKNNYVEAKNISNNNKEITVTYNGEKLEFDQEPIIENGRTKVPFRKIFESMGTIVYYNNSESTIMALTKTGDIITHKIGTNKATINGVEKDYDSNSTLLNGRTVVPVRMISDLLGASVEWLEKDKLVEIEKEEESIDSTRKDIMSHVLDINYNPKDTNRYVEYKKKHKEMSTEQVIMDVNMDLDRELILTSYSGKNLLLKDLKWYTPKIEDIEIIENPDDILAYSNKFNRYPEDYCPSDLVFANSEKLCMPKQGYNAPNVYLRKEAADNYLEMFNYYLNTYNVLNTDLELQIGYDNQKNMLPTIDTAIASASKYFGIQEGGQYAYNSFEEPGASRFQSGLTFYIYNTPFSPSNVLRYARYSNMQNSKLEAERAELVKYEDLIFDWILNNCYKYGFCQLYTERNQYITKITPQKNCLNYVGKDVAYKMHEENISFDEYCAKYTNPTVNDRQYSIDSESTQKVLKKY